MSRIGKQPIEVPADVRVRIDEKTSVIQIEGPKGQLEFSYCSEVSVRSNDSDRTVSVSIPDSIKDDGRVRALWGTTRSRISGMIRGVTSGFEKKLEIVGTGWNAKAQGNRLILNLGYCHPIELDAPAGIDFKVEGQVVTVSGCDKEAVGQFAAVIRSKRPPEPYKGKGVKYAGEYILRKQGKAFGS